MDTNRIWYGNMTAPIPAKWHYATGTFALVCLFCGLISNGCVIVMFLRNSSLRRPKNYFIINLAICDIGLLLTNNSMHVIASYKTEWPFGQLGCNLYSVCGGVFGLSSIATMATIALIRLIVVLTPFNSMKMNSNFILKCLACSWIYGSMWILPPLFGWNRFILEGFETSCTFDYVSKSPSDRSFILFLVIGGFFVPLFVIIVSYACILLKLFERGRRLAASTIDADNVSLQSHQLYFFQFYYASSTFNDDRTRSGTISMFDLNDDNPVLRSIRLVEIRATRTALLACALFCLAWGPYSLMTLAAQFGFEHFVNPYSTALLALMTKTAACINPLVYALSSSTFRRQLCACLTNTDWVGRRIQHNFIAVNRAI